MTKLLPCPIDDLRLHIVPATEGCGGGVSVAPGNILVCLISDKWSPIRLQRNVSHEYSHAVRQIQKPQVTEHGYGNAVPYTVRDFLVFEGLATVLAETLFPAPIPFEAVADAEEKEWWSNTDVDAIGFDAYARYRGSLGSYEIGARIVRSYLRTHQLSIIGAHDLTDHEIYWNSDYEFIR